jgi:hypothetical protein
MSTTSAYGWNIPDNTDLVKDGALAIRTLGNAIDTSMNTALGTKKAGMVLLNTTSFSAVASQAVTPIFSATYTSYRVLLTISSASSDGFIYMKLRSGATDASSGYDYANNFTSTASANIPDGGTGQTTGLYFSTLDSGTSNVYSYVIDIHNPFTASITTANHLGTCAFSNGTKNNVAGANWHMTASSYDGLNIIPSAGNITGKVQVYGYNQ